VTAKANPIVGAMIHKDGKLQPVAGPDPSAQWTYRVEPSSTGLPQQKVIAKAN